MARMNAGILGGYSGTIEEVTGYKRLGKNIITSKVKYQSINHIPSLVSNTEKLTRIMHNYSLMKRGIDRILLTFYGTRIFTADEIYLANRATVFNADPRYLGPFIIPIQSAFFNNSAIQNVNLVTSSLECISIKQLRSSIAGGTNFLRRFRYTGYNNNLVTANVNVITFSQGIATSFSLGPAGSVYLAATCLTNNPYTKSQDLFVSGFRK
jgi:hypothetical protein